MIKLVSMTKGRIIQMSNKKIFVVLGADMVGKTTLINNSIKVAKKLGKKCAYTHFSAPPPGKDPCEMYIDSLAEFMYENQKGEGFDYWYLDRAWPESKFYELHRRQNDISMIKMMTVEKTYADFAEALGFDISVNLLYKPWEFIEKFHVHELENNKDFVVESALKNNESTDIMERKVEFMQYYAFMKRYFQEREREYPDIVKHFPMNGLTIFDLKFNLI